MDVNTIGAPVRNGTAETMEFLENMDATLGLVTAGGEVVVRGHMLDGARLAAAGNITVQGSVEGAMINGAGDLNVKDGIYGKESGRVRIGGMVRARFTANADIVAAGDVSIEKEVASTRIICGGKFSSESGVILSGHITAAGGIVCQSAGSTGGSRTILELGLNPEEIARVDQVFKDLSMLRKRTEDIRRSVVPLMQNPKLLNAQQKEKATELLYLADEAEATVREKEATLERPAQQVRRALEGGIDVRNELHIGVIIRYLGFEAALRIPMKGPLKIVLQSVGGDAQLAFIDPEQKIVGSLSTIALPCQSVLKQLQLRKA